MSKDFSRTCERQVLFACLRDAAFNDGRGGHGGNDNKWQGIDVDADGGEQTGMGDQWK